MTGAIVIVTAPTSWGLMISCKSTLASQQNANRCAYKNPRHRRGYWPSRGVYRARNNMTRYGSAFATADEASMAYDDASEWCTKNLRRAS